MILLDPQRKYFTAEESRNLGYLAKRFAQIRRQLNEQAVAQKTADEEVLLKVRELSKDRYLNRRRRAGMSLAVSP